MPNKPIKVVHIVEGFLGGVCTYICTVLSELAGNGFDVTLICSLGRCSPNAQQQLADLQRSGVKVHIVSMGREIAPVDDICAFFAIFRLLLKNKFDIVHTHCSKAGGLGRCAAFLAGVPAILHSPHCFSFLRCGSRFSRMFYLFAERCLGKLTTRLIAVSKSEADLAVQLRIIRRDKCACVRNGLATGGRSWAESFEAGAPERQAAKRSLGLDEDQVVVITACRLVDYKGIFKFLEAARICRIPRAVFLLAGDGELRAAASEFVRENKLTGKVRLLGHISDMEPVLAASDVVVLCSDAEAQPYLLLEAMRARRPIVATSVIGNSELISHRQTGLLAKPDAESIAAAIEELLSDRRKRGVYAKNAYDYFCRQHLLQDQISAMTRVYRTCVLDSQRQRTERLLGAE